jgi:hypothetical protein
MAKRSKPKPLRGAKALINKRGGAKAVSAALGWPYTTVHTFVRHNCAPKYRWDVIAALPVVSKQVAA